MQIGVVFPQTEIGADVGAVRAYAQRAEELGFRHLLAYDHVLGADPAVHEGWNGPYDVDTTFHEPLVLFGYLAAITRLELVTGIIILPQRQTALVAKQAAEVDLLTEGRFRLGIGLGWNRVEYEALGKDFTNRGPPRPTSRSSCCGGCGPSASVTFDGRRRAGHRSRAGARCRCSGRSRSGSAPSHRPPTGGPGGSADGWFPQVPPGPDLDAARAIVEQAAVDGRPRPGRPSAWRAGSAGTATPTSSSTTSAAGAQAGATHLSLNTMNTGLTGADQHLAAIEQAASALGLTPA